MTRISPTLRTWLLAFFAAFATGYAVWFHFLREKPQKVNPNIIQIQLQIPK